MCILKKFIVVCVGLLLNFVASSAFGADVTVAGFAFAGDFKSAAERFPYTYRLFKSQQAGVGKGSFSLAVNERVKLIKGAKLDYRGAEGLVSLKSSDQALMAVLMLTGETVGVEDYGAYHKTFVNLRGDALIFDYKSQTVVRSYPISVVLFDATPTRPSDDRIVAFVDDLFRREDGHGLITQFIRRLEAATLPREGTKTVQVRKGAVTPEALALLPESLRKNPDAVEAMLADSLGSILSAKVGISMLPSSIGHAVGGVMTMRLENGDDYKLKLGEGDYLLDVKINKFAKIKTAETNVSTTYVYGVYSSIRFYEPMLNTTFFESDLKNGESAVVPAGQIAADDFAAYQDSIRGLFLKLSDALNNPGSKWIAVAASQKNVESQLEVAREALRKCK